jgi:hypothetical protein
VKDDTLSSFERKTVIFAKWGILVAFLSLVAASVAGYYVFQQFQEMAMQTNILNGEAGRARRDAKDTGIATAQQLALSRQQVSAAQDANRETVELFKRRNRPWVGVEGDVVFDDNIAWVGAVGEAIVRQQRAEGKLPMRVLYHMRNSGESPALNTVMVVRPVTFPETGPVDPARIRAEVEEDCKLAEKSITRGNGDLVLPGGVYTEPFQFGEWEPTKFLFTPGCIVYRDVDRKLHHTRICYAVAMFLSPKPKGLESCQNQSAD